MRPHSPHHRIYFLDRRFCPSASFPGRTVFRHSGEFVLYNCIRHYGETLCETSALDARITLVNERIESDADQKMI